MVVYRRCQERCFCRLPCLGEKDIDGAQDEYTVEVCSHHPTDILGSGDVLTRLSYPCVALCGTGTFGSFGAMHNIQL